MTKLSIENISVVILGAGCSERMGFPKVFLPWDKDKTFIEQITQQYHSMGFKDIIAVINCDTIKFADFAKKKLLNNFKLVINSKPEKGRIFSSQLAFQNISNKSCILQNVDNPFVNKELITQIIENYAESSYVVPTYNGKGGHPILLSPEIINYLSNIQEYNLKLSEILHRFKRIEIESSDPHILININTFEEYQKYLPLLNQKPEF